jgi:hypothetical protein
MADACNLSYLGGSNQKDCVEANQIKKLVRPYLNKKAGCGLEVWLNDECLPCKHEALSSNPGNEKKKKKAGHNGMCLSPQI